VEVHGDAIQLTGLAGSGLIGFLLVLARVGGLFLLAPGFSSRMIPVRVKIAIAFAISLAITPVAMHGHNVGAETADLPLLVLKEITVGVAFALPLAFVAAGIQAGATLLDTLIGFSFASTIDPINNGQNAVLAQLYSLFAVMIFFLGGGDAIMLEGLSASYRVVPIDVVPNMAKLSANLVPLAGQVFVIGLEIAAPVVIALIVTDAAFGLIARAVPQLNVFFVGLPAKIMLGFAVISASLPFVAARISDQLEASVFTALRVLHAA
jgi:flagellar biosynthetic protein FliR